MLPIKMKSNLLFPSFSSWPNLIRNHVLVYWQKTSLRDVLQVGSFHMVKLHYVRQIGFGNIF